MAHFNVGYLSRKSWSTASPTSSQALFLSAMQICVHFNQQPRYFTHH